MQRARVEPGPILFRCDGTAETGFGHVSRCLALAEALQECGFHCRFLGRYAAGAVKMLESAEMSLDHSPAGTGGAEDLRITIDYIRNRHVVATVLDSYQVDESYLSTLDRETGPLCLIDDFGRFDRYDCAVVLNCTVNAPQLAYPTSKAHFLLGPEYFLARRRLRVLRRAVQPRSGAGRKVLVAIGGVDQHDLSRLVTSALLEIASQLSVRVVVGCGYPWANELAQLLGSFEGGGHLETQLPDLAEQFAWADICVCGGGLTKYEAAYLGVPAAVLSQNRTQAEETVQFCGRGLAADMGLWEDANANLLADRLSGILRDAAFRRSLSERGLSYFPTDPTQHAAAAMATIINQSR